MNAQDLTLIIGGIPVVAAAVVSVIIALRSASQTKANTAQLSAHLTAEVHPLDPTNFQERTGTTE